MNNVSDGQIRMSKTIIDDPQRLPIEQIQLILKRCTNETKVLFIGDEHKEEYDMEWE